MASELITLQPATGIPSIPPTETSRAMTQQSGAAGGANPRHLRLWLAAVGVFAIAFLVAHCLLTSRDMPAKDPHDRPALSADAVPAKDPAHRSTLSADALYARSSSAVVKVVVHDRWARSTGTGSGFLVSTRALFATNYHVIKKAHMAHVVLADKTLLSVAGVVAVDEEADIAIIKVAGQISAQPLELSLNDLPPVGAKVYAIGTPLGRFANTLSDGLVSGHREQGTIPYFPRVPTMIQTTAPISHGSSGGPLIAADGKVVGVTTLLFDEGQNLNLAIPASHVARLLLRCQGELQLAQFPLDRAGSALAFVERGNAWFSRNEYDKAIKDYDAAIELDPEDAYAYMCRGNAWSNKKEYDKAIKDYSEAIQLDPNNAEYYYKRGTARYFKREDNKAFKDFDEANRLDPKRFRR